jgi:hypothetical protein
VLALVYHVHVDFFVTKSPGQAKVERLPIKILIKPDITVFFQDRIYVRLLEVVRAQVLPHLDFRRYDVIKVFVAFGQVHEIEACIHPS